MKQKLCTILFILVLSFLKTSAQQALVSSGGDATGAGGSSSFTIGQVVYTTNTGATGSIAQGVQQPFEIQTVLGTENFNINLQLEAYPNPTANWLNLEVKNTNFDNLTCQLLDLNGRLIYNLKITEQLTRIPMEQLPTALFLLKVLDSNKEIKTFKILKNQF